MDKMYQQQQQQQGSVQLEYQCNQWVLERKKNKRQNCQQVHRICQLSMLLNEKYRNRDNIYMYFIFIFFVHWILGTLIWFEPRKKIEPEKKTWYWKHIDRKRK